MTAPIPGSWTGLAEKPEGTPSTSPSGQCQDGAESPPRAKPVEGVN